ncbi:DsbA family oxidoreductase [Orrella sp. NBD-18]|uniref:DsbA family oxidoreductase n=1 Tax=Sheuella amnicola TaxID=2707330 RepID=A0A6B2R3V6_9BURK|nr:DsbA family oxidoreductase [Sheuella amnicola]NDY83737.1 DsbA family oxidoreductase [Sheuella amnicola]
MNEKIIIDVVSDIACPWCAVGLGSLEQAVKQVEDEIKIEIRFQPFELNPDMPQGGQEVIEHLMQKYGMPEEQIRRNQANIYNRAAAVGFHFHPEGRKHVYNTFDSHRLLHWALTEYGPLEQYRLKKELLATYFTLAVNLDDQSNLIDAVQRAGLDIERAGQVLESGAYADDVRTTERKYTGMGINSVPSLIFNQKYLLQGAQPVDSLVQALRQLAAQQSSTS